jgi:type III pantothenate kinase
MGDGDTILAVDVGNTRTAVAVFKGRRIVRRFFAETSAISKKGRARKFLLPAMRQGPKGACISSVVPAVTKVFASTLRRDFKLCVVVASPKNSGMRLSGYDARQIGIDRVVAAIAAYERAGRATIVMDAGSCITIDAVSVDGRFLGGLIFPGIGTLLSSLCSMTARIGKVKYHPHQRPYGKNTSESVNLGIGLAIGGLVDNAVAAMKRALGARPALIATGGTARPVCALSSHAFRYFPDLQFDGIRLIWKRNRGDQ